MILRRLAASLAAAALVLGGAVVAVPAVAASVAAPAPDPAFLIIPSGQDHVEPGRVFGFYLDITRRADLEVPSGSQIALTITYPDTIAFEGGDCDAYVFAATGEVRSAPTGFVSGDECVVEGDIAADPDVFTRLTFASVEPLAETPPSPALLEFAIGRVVVLSETGDYLSESQATDPPAVVTDTVDFDVPPYLAEVSADGVTWPDEESISVQYSLSAPDLSADGNRATNYSWASTTWELRGPDFAKLVTEGDDSGWAACENDAAGDGFCQVTMVQDGSCRSSYCVADSGSPGTPGPRPGLCQLGYCSYSIDLKFLPARDIDANAVTGDFRMRSIESSFVAPGSPPAVMPSGWIQDAATSHTVVRQVVGTSVSLSADSRAIGGEDITATISAKQFDDADVLARYPEDDPWLEVDLTLDWPYFLQMIGTPTGCHEWRASQRVCVLRFYESPPGEAKEISATFAIPTHLPPYGLSGAVSVSASHVEMWSSGDGDYSLGEAPTSTVAPSSAPFEVYEPALETSVYLSASEGWPGGSDVVASYAVSHLQASSLDVVTGNVELRLSWPDFLTPVAPPDGVCDGFVADPAGGSGTCTVTGVGPPGWSDEFEMTFAMPPEGSDEPMAGEVGIAGVALTASDSDGVQTVYDSRYILPSTAPFAVDREVFSVDVSLDRQVSTVDGVRLAAEIRVAYDHVAQSDSDIDAVGIEIGWPDFLEVVDPPEIVGCDERDDDICYLTQMESVGDTQVVRVWFDMPADTGSVGNITAMGVRLCDGPVDDCTELPAAWIGSDAEQFAVLEPQITVDVTVDRDTGWTGGQPVTATATLRHEGPIPGALPGLIVDVILDWPGFLTPISIGGCEEILVGGVCRVAGLDSVGTSKQLVMQFGMPLVEPPGTVPSAYPVVGDIRVSGIAFAYLAPPPTPLPSVAPCANPTPGPTASPSPTPTPGASPTPTPTPTCAPSPSPAAVATPTPTPTVTPTPVTPPPATPPRLALASPAQSVSDLTTLTPQDLVDSIVGSGVSTSNIVYTGDDRGAGRFSGFDAVGFSSGLILSSGEAVTAPGPNKGEDTTGDLAEPGDSDLDAVVSSVTYDASVLTFDFVPTTSQLTFDYVFASDEYSEFSTSEFNDVFAFFVNGTNCALTPDGAAVSVNTINGGSPLGTNPQRPELFRDNSIVVDDAGVQSSPIDVEADGLTTVMHCVASVNANRTNTMKLAIADTSDSEWDSEVFIAAGSVQANHPPVAADQSVTTNQETSASLTLSATDTDGDSLTYSVVAQPSHGTLSGSGADLTYTPTAGYSGPDAFTFTANDGAVDSETATVTITVNPVTTPPPPPPPGSVSFALPPEWIGSDSVSVRVLQPKATIVPSVARPGGVVTVYLENFPPTASLTLSWTTGSGSRANMVLAPDVLITQFRVPIFRRELLGARGLVVTSTDGSFGELRPAANLLVVPRSTVADELVGRGG